MRGRWKHICLSVFLAVLSSEAVIAAAPVHAYEKVELTFVAAVKHSNPYTDVEVWVDLKGPHFSKRCYGF